MSEIIWDPVAIERRSYEIIDALLPNLVLPPGELRVVRRVVHTTGDASIAALVAFAPSAVADGVRAVQAGCNVYTDVRMVGAGISETILARFGGQVRCLIAEPGVKETAEAAGITRAAAAVRLAGTRLSGQIVAVGNAPTALFELLAAMEGGLRPALVIGAPVGFVGAAEAKELLTSFPVPWIAVRGTRGGSTVCAAIINAILHLSIIP